MNNPYEEYLALVRDFQEVIGAQETPYLLATADEKIALTPEKFQAAAPEKEIFPEVKRAFLPPEKKPSPQEVEEIVIPKVVPKPPKETSLNPVFEEFSPLIGKWAPHLKVLKTPPSDHTAQKRSHEWQILALEAEVIVFTKNPSSEEMIFLTQLTAAIDTKLCSAKKLDVALIEEPSDWKIFCESGKIKLVIATGNVFQYPAFLQLVKKNAASNTYFLGSIPLLVLEPFAAYAEHPPKKKQLWTRLCTLLNRSLPAS